MTKFEFKQDYQVNSTNLKFTGIFRQQIYTVPHILIVPDSLQNITSLVDR